VSAEAKPERQFFNYAALFNAGVLVTIGTDLPLFIPSIPDAIYAACCRHFADGSPPEGWYREHGMTRTQLLKAWTINAAVQHGMGHIPEVWPWASARILPCSTATCSPVPMMKCVTRAWC
jgi:predicted amidohydrolase YtcJ